jgi:hypothetical protein
MVLRVGAATLTYFFDSSQHIQEITSEKVAALPWTHLACSRSRLAMEKKIEGGSEPLLGFWAICWLSDMDMGRE